MPQSLNQNLFKGGSKFGSNKFGSNSANKFFKGPAFPTPKKNAVKSTSKTK
jgi:hypothetical protein